MYDLNAFARKYQGQIVTDPWGTYKGQCVSLVKRWIQANGWPMRMGNAIQWQYNGYGGYKFYKNYWWTIPKAGDIAVFRVGQYGHVGIVMPGATTSSMRVLNQNWPHGNAKDPVTITTFNYINPKVIGFLRKV